MAEIKWVKLDTGLPDNRKIKQIRRLPNGDTMALAWVFLVCLAGDINDHGSIYLTDGVPYTDEMLAEQFGMDVSTIRMAMEVFQRFRMIEIQEDGVICISSWEDHQSTDRMAEIREYNRIAKQRSRARKKQLESGKDDVNDKSMTSHRGHDTEEEREEDKEEENHSFIHSGAEGQFSEEFSTGFSTGKEDAKRRYLGGELGKGVVLLSQEQMDDLLEKLSIEEFDRYVNVVARVELSGKHYKKKTHYQAILDMAEKDRAIKKGG